ncbi:MAG: FRG domain-containing protein [Bryobacteraceae bacterium]|nr:FRG domain-containing protein [Bryobacteraceae bacterium]
MDVVVSSWGELHDRLYEGSWDDHIGRFRSSMAYRGLSDASYQLKTSLMRLGGGYQRLEGNLLRNFRKYAQRNVVPADSMWNWLATAQHHGLPTRLLDWTFSPYIAMHFATANTQRVECDGVIWCVDYIAVHKFLPGPLREILDCEASNLITAEMLNRVVKSLPELDGLAKDPFVIFFEPPSLDERIVNQYALFSLMSNPCALLDEWLESHPDTFKRIVIPAKLKWEVRDKLDQANITERVLFPGLDGLSRWLTRHYSPSPGAGRE